MNNDSDFTIKTGWMVDGFGSAVQKDISLTVRGDRIARIDKVDGLLGKEPDLDLGACLVLPGLIDSHVHLFMSGTADSAVREWQLNAPYVQMREVIMAHLQRHLTCGVVAVRDGGDYGAHALRYKISTTAESASPVTLHAAGRAWRRDGRYGRLIGRPPAAGQTLAQAIKDSQEPFDHIKIVNSGLNSLRIFGKETAPQFSLDELRAVVKLASARQKKIMVHVNGRKPVQQTLSAGCHSIEHGFFMGADNLHSLAESQAFWVPTACTMQGYAEHASPGSLEGDIARRNLDHQLEQLSHSRKLGVKVALGTDAGTVGVDHGAAVGMEMALLLSAGFTLPEAVECATRNGAELMGLPETGGIVSGYRATLLALPGGPQAFPANLATPAWLMIDGRTVFDHRV